jgi:hypothetical protein
VIDPSAAVPEGHRLEGSNRPKDWLGSVDQLPLADEKSVELARRHLPEASADDFERDAAGRWVERATGEVYNIVGFNPLLAGDPADTGVTSFVISDGFIVFLAPRGATGRAQVVQLGSVGGMLATGKERV